jgi:hypothetical protein
MDIYEEHQKEKAQKAEWIKEAEKEIKLSEEAKEKLRKTGKAFFSQKMKKRKAMMEEMNELDQMFLAELIKEEEKKFNMDQETKNPRKRRKRATILTNDGNDGYKQVQLRQSNTVCDHCFDWFIMQMNKNYPKEVMILDDESELMCKETCVDVDLTK